MESLYGVRVSGNLLPGVARVWGHVGGLYPDTWAVAAVLCPAPVHLFTTLVGHLLVPCAAQLLSMCM